MKWKNIVPLAAILVVLLAIIVLMQSAEETQSIQEAVGFERLVPESVNRADIERLELFAGEKPEEKLVLARSADNPQQWVVASHVDAPVSEEKVDGFLDVLMGLVGEPREQGVSDAGLTDYMLQSDKAFQVAGYGGDGAQLFHLLEGKRDEYNEGFARRNESNDVYLIDDSLKREAGIYGEETDKAPEYGMWLDKVIYEVAQDSIERVEMAAPGKRLVIEQQTGSAASDAAEAAADETEDTEGAEGAETNEEAGSEPDWVIAEGGPNLPTNEANIRNFIQSIAKMQCVDYVDPARKAELGLEGETPFRTVVASNELDEDIVIQGNRPDPSENGYVIVSTKPDRVFEMAKNIFEKLFGVETSADFFEDEGLDIDYDSITRIEYEYPEGRVALAREEDGAWQIEQPEAPLPVQDISAAGIGRLLARWQPDEYFAGDTPDAGLAQPAYKVTVTAEGETTTILVGDQAEYYDGRYAQLQGEPRVVLMKRVDVDKVFLDPNDLYERTLFDAEADEVSMLMLRKGDDAVVLSREGAGWRATSLGENQEVHDDAVDAYLTALLDLQAEKIRFGEAALPDTPEASAVFVDGAGERHEVVFGPAGEETRVAALSDKNLVFEVGTLDAAEILVDPASLAQEIEPASEPVPAAPETESSPAEGPAEEADLLPEEEAAASGAAMDADASPAAAAAEPAADAGTEGPVEDLEPAEAEPQEPAAEPEAEAPAEE